MHAWLIENWEKEPEKAAKVSRFLTVAEMVVKSQYPGSAKAYLGTEYPGFAIEPQSVTTHQHGHSTGAARAQHGHSKDTARTQHTSTAQTHRTDSPHTYHTSAAIFDYLSRLSQL